MLTALSHDLSLLCGLSSLSIKQYCTWYAEAIGPLPHSQSMQFLRTFQAGRTRDNELFLSHCS